MVTTGGLGQRQTAGEEGSAIEMVMISEDGSVTEKSLVELLNSDGRRAEGKDGRGKFDEMKLLICGISIFLF